MLFTSVEELARTRAFEEGHEPGVEIADGVRIVRRQAFRLAAYGLGVATLGGGRSIARQDDTGPFGRGPTAQPLDFDGMVDRLRPLARRLVAEDDPDEETYLRAVAELLSRLDPIPEPWSEPRFPPGGDQAYGLSLWYPPLVVFEIVMKPGAVIELHDHRFYNGVLMAVEGRVQVRNFEIFDREDLPPMGEEFLIRQTASRALEPGQSASLSRTRDNLHEVRAGDREVRLLDVFTYFRPEARSFEIAFDDRPIDRDRGLYKVAWKESG
ncbi:cupin domain-containing protein [Tautonia rosea]|uniref:hypothetical protein n=1 Tax=Tautonia rosea TaxID=2728037 RepID=UPI001473A6D6|nr:hypothetical protein [Tautonia rosea]